MSNNIELIYNEETGKWEKHKPYKIIEFLKKEDWDRFKEVIKFWNDNHENEDDKIWM